MSFRQAAWVLLIVVSCHGALLADEVPLENGLYEVHFRLELPHLEKYAIDRKTTICVDQGRLDLQDPPLPLLSQNDIFEDCRIKNVQKDRRSFSYDIACAGRGAARATATYVMSPEEFSSRISIIQGAKNMTMTEIQSGHRLGSCDKPS